MKTQQLQTNIQLRLLWVSRFFSFIDLGLPHFSICLLMIYFFKTFISLFNVHRDLPVYLEYYKFNYIGCKGGAGGWGWGNNKLLYNMMR